MIDLVFYLCVKIMIVAAHFLGLTYQQLNVLLFVVIHPAITLYLFIKNRHLKKRLAHSSTR